MDNFFYFDGNMGYKNERIFDSQMAVIWLPNGLKFGHQKNQNSAAKWAEIRPPKGPKFVRQMSRNSAAKGAKIRSPNEPKFVRQRDQNSASKWAKNRLKTPPSIPNSFSNWFPSKILIKIYQVFFISLIKLHQPFNLQQNF